MIPQHNITLSKENVEEHITDKRRKNIGLRLVSVDEPPQKRRELRAEMKGMTSAFPSSMPIDSILEIQLGNSCLVVHFFRHLLILIG